MTRDQLTEVLRLHGMWLRVEPGGERANLAHANLAYADLADADLAHADLTHANLADAYLADAYLAHAIGIICAGTDPRGYRFVGVAHPDGPRVAAGCRWLTIAEAREHWAYNRDALARVALIEAVLS